jgi:glyoxylase-like metal-dependent hydrolase (beta-lactamase superfamily II)
MASLGKLQQRADRIYYPAHGPAVEAPQKLLRGLILHRRQRESQILAELERGAGLVPTMVQKMYKSLDPRLHPAAERSVLAHLIDLEARGLVTSDGPSWSLAE